MSTITSIILPTRPQPDTIVAIFLLQKFGQDMYPGVKEAAIKSDPKATAEEGCLLIDVGGGEFDHHGSNKCATELVAEKLGVRQNPELRNLIAYARRDDTKGQGTISKDQLDRAFGLSGLISSLNKKHQYEPGTIVNIVLPLLEAHYYNSYEHYVAMPELIQSLQASGDIVTHTLAKPLRNMGVAFVTSDNVSLAGYLRSNSGGNYKVLVQSRSSGHVNILTKQNPKIDLSELMAAIRLRELQLQHVSDIDQSTLYATAVHSEVPNWYYDTATNSLLNGGVTPDDIKPTSIPWHEMQAIVLSFLERSTLEQIHPVQKK